MSLIAVLSDSHDNIWNLDKALQAVRKTGAAHLLHCGDFVAPFIMQQLAEGFDGPIHCVYGNNDGDPHSIVNMAGRWDRLRVHGQWAELEIDGVRIAMNHYPELARPLALSGLYDLVCYGHNHLQNWERIGHCQLANPGEIMGRLGAPSWGLFDTESRTWSFRTLDE